MKRPDPVWEFDYKANRRKHNHRCFCCKKIIKAGERVLMCRKQGGGTKACHIEHGDKPHVDSSSITVREVMRIWGLRVLKKKGWKVEDWELVE